MDISPLHIVVALAVTGLLIAVWLACMVMFAARRSQRAQKLPEAGPGA